MISDKRGREALLTTKEAAEALSVKPETLRGYVKAKLIVPVRLGGFRNLRFEQSELDRFIAESRDESPRNVPETESRVDPRQERGAA